MENRVHQTSEFMLNMYESAKDLHEVGAISDEELKEFEALCLSPDDSPLISDENLKDSTGLS